MAALAGLGNFNHFCRRSASPFSVPGNGISSSRVCSCCRISSRSLPISSSSSTVSKDSSACPSSIASSSASAGNAEQTLSSTVVGCSLSMIRSVNSLRPMSPILIGAICFCPSAHSLTILVMARSLHIKLMLPRPSVHGMLPV